MVKSKSSRKTLSFSVSAKEYSDFWYIAELLGESKKKPTLLKMMDIIKKQYNISN